MKTTLSIIKKELASYFVSPVAFIFLVIFLITQMGFTFILGRFFDSNNASLEIFFTFHPWLYLFLVPAIGMRLWAEEKREGTIEFLMTLPVSLYQLIIGKFVASWIFLGVALLLTFPVIITVFYLGSPDLGPIFTGYFASWLMAGAYLAITSFTSSLTKNQVISFITSVVICFVLVLLGFGVFQQYLSFLGTTTADFLANLGFITHFQPAMRGVIDFRDLVYFLSIIAFFLALNTAVLEQRGASGSRTTATKNLANATNVVILFFALIATNFVFSYVRLKADFTADGLYTLSEGSEKIVEKIDDEATIKYFFSATMEGLPVMVKNYGKRVQEVLEEFASMSGNLKLEVYNPKPDSDEEELAAKHGVFGVQAGAGEQFHMGAAVLFRDKTYKIPFFDPRKETFLEYDIASMLSKLTTSSDKRKLGILSGVMFAPPAMPPQFGGGQQPEDTWAFRKELEKTMEVKELSKDIEEIPEDVSTLLVFHPKDFNEKTVYAIEQFILRGGKAIIAVDPSAKSDAQKNNPYAQYGMQQGSSSNIPKIFEMLQIDYSADKVAADKDNAARVNSPQGPVRFPFWISADKSAFNGDIVVTNQLKTGLFVESGFFTPKKGAPIKYTSLVNTSANSGTIEKSRLTFMQPQDYDSFTRSDKPLSLAGIVQGKFKSTFSDKPAESKHSGKHIVEAKEELTVVVIGDIDFANNAYSIRELNFFGQTIVQPINQNITFLANSLEFIAGSPELISIRSRGSFSRPFEKVEEIEKKAQSKWFQVEKELTGKIQSLQTKLNELQRAKTEGNQLALSSAQEEEIRRFQKEQIRFKKERREVRKNLRQDIEVLGTVLTASNMGIIPLFVLLFGVFVYVRRSAGRSILKRRK
jgi:ABC-type uncharacterized transport system involved in gliding motility auxiliary subunit/ABC-type transport system involved in cytochrome c biogenesis permease component